MYSNCSSATSLPQMDTSLGTLFSNMYYGCYKAKTLPPLNTSLGTNFNSMYRDCREATDFPALDTILGTDLGYMYYQCYLVKKIDISHYNVVSNKSNYMFAFTNILKAVIIRSFGENYGLDATAFNYCYHMKGITHIDFNPQGLQDGYIYVPRNMIETLQAATNWSAMQFRALEDYTDDGTTTGKFLDEKAGL